jgi:MYXO-CTERM domain-containing protein
MSRSGQGAGRPSSASIAAASSRSAAQPGDSGFEAQAALGLVGLGMVGHMLRSRRFYEKVAVAAIVLGALKGIGHDNQVSTMARLQAWDKREIQRLESKARRQGRAVKDSARMARSRTRRGLAGAGPQN